MKQQPTSPQSPEGAPADPPRYAPHATLPATRYIPGRGDRPALHHPPADPRADAPSSDRPEPILRPLGEGVWRDHSRYLFGCDLFNSGYFWEAHEAWEELWHEDVDPRTRSLLQALILLAAMHLKEKSGDTHIASILRRRAGVAARAACPDRRTPWLGVDPTWLRDQCGEDGGALPSDPPKIILQA